MLTNECQCPEGSVLGGLTLSAIGGIAGTLLFPEAIIPAAVVGALIGYALQNVNLNPLLAGWSSNGSSSNYPGDATSYIDTINSMMSPSPQTQLLSQATQAIQAARQASSWDLFITASREPTSPESFTDMLDYLNQKSYGLPSKSPDTQKSIQTQLDTAIRAIKGEKDLSIKAVQGEKDTSVKAIKGEHDTAVKAVKGEKDTSIKAIKGEHDTAVKAVKGEKETSVKAVKSEKETAVQVIVTLLARLFGGSPTPPQGADSHSLYQPPGSGSNG